MKAINHLALTLAAAFLLTGPAAAGPVARTAPAITASQWLNSAPLTMEGLRSRVVLVEFWTRGCWNCRNVEPHIKAWHERYRNQGLVVVGVHAPEFPYERDIDGLRAYLHDHAITYPVAVDNDFASWHAWQNRAWPTIYLVGKQGAIRYQRIGEGGYEETEATIRRLLAE